MCFVCFLVLFVCFCVDFNVCFDILSRVLVRVFLCVFYVLCVCFVSVCVFSLKLTVHRCERVVFAVNLHQFLEPLSENNNTENQLNGLETRKESEKNNIYSGQIKT